jgi:hypothetical protein
LESITVARDNTVYHAVDNCLIETATSTLILGCKNSIIPSGIVKLDHFAFESCNGLISVTIPDSVTSIEDYVFGYCENLNDVTMGSNVTQIGVGAFGNCPKLTIYTLAGSYVEGYAKENNIPFVSNGERVNKK